MPQKNEQTGAKEISKALVQILKEWRPSVGTLWNATVVILTAFIIAVGSDVFRAANGYQALVKSVEKLEGLHAHLQQQLYEGTQDRFTRSEADREYDKLEAAIKENQQRIRMLEAR